VSILDSPKGRVFEVYLPITVRGVLMAALLLGLCALIYSLLNNRR
jgi:hypothetical protein